MTFSPLLICWLVAMFLVMFTPTALLFGAALWRVVSVLIFEIAMLAFIGWLRKQ